MIRIALSLMVMLFGTATLLQAQEGAPEKRRISSRSRNSPQTDSLLYLLKIPGMRWDSLLARLAAINQAVPDRGRAHRDARLLGEMPPLLSRMIAGRIHERCYIFGIEDGYWLDVMTDDDTIVAASLRRAGKEALRVIDTARLRVSVAGHEKLFRTRIDFSDRSMVSFESYRFGVACGEASGPPDELQELVYLLGHDLTTMRRWSRSLNPEIQAYGALGLLYLQWTGEKISEDDEAVLAVLRGSSVSVHMCHGCIGHHLPMSQALTYLPLPWVMKRIKGMVESEP